MSYYLVDSFQNMREFNTSGQNIPERHYTLLRPQLVEKGVGLVKREKYFTIWAPRQTGKSTYFILLAEELRRRAYKVAWINLEDYQQTSKEVLLKYLISRLHQFWSILFESQEISDLFNEIEKIQDQKLVLIIDEVEGVNKAYFGSFLHSIRRIYHSRTQHSLKSVILVGVSNITGIVRDNANPFNITDNLDIPFFNKEETFELLNQHEIETGQLFDLKVKEKIVEITANQPGLVNGFARKLVEDNPNKEIIEYQDYLIVEDWYLNKAIDKNVSNIVNKAEKHRNFVEKLLFTENKEPFRIDRPAIKELHTNGLVTWDKEGNVVFWVPLYQKKLFYAFYPYTNGEGQRISQTMLASAYLTQDNKVDFDKLIDRYKKHIELRSFRPYREKDEKGNFKSIKEAAMIYSFETFISIFIQEIEGKSYREAIVSLGNSDLIINVKGIEYLIETKKYYSPQSFIKGKGLPFPKGCLWHGMGRGRGM